MYIVYMYILLFLFNITHLIIQVRTKKIILRSGYFTEVYIYNILLSYYRYIYIKRYCILRQH